MSTFVIDTFTEGSSTVNLSAHTPDVGGTWVKHPSYSDDIQVDFISDEIFGSTGTGSFYYNTASPASADYYSQVLISIPNNAIATYPGCGVRADTASDTLYLIYFDQIDLKIHLQRKLSGVVTEIGLGSAHTINNGETHTMRLEIAGSNITVRWDGIVDINVSDGNISTAGKAGVSQYSTPGQQISYFEAADLISGSLPFSFSIDAKRV